jgi:hypothetical protein
MDATIQERFDTIESMTLEQARDYVRAATTDPAPLDSDEARFLRWRLVRAAATKIHRHGERLADDAREAARVANEKAYDAALAAVVPWKK